MRTISVVVALLLSCTDFAGAQARVAQHDTGRVYMEFQVDTPVQSLGQPSRPAYPEALRKRGVEAEVQARFVVDTSGIPDTASFRILKSPDKMFSDAVRAVLPKLRYSPAQVGGRKVRQLVAQQFMFKPPT